MKISQLYCLLGILVTVSTFACTEKSENSEFKELVSRNKKNNDVIKEDIKEAAILVKLSEENIKAKNILESIIALESDTTAVYQEILENQVQLSSIYKEVAIENIVSIPRTINKNNLPTSQLTDKSLVLLKLKNSIQLQEQLINQLADNLKEEESFKYIEKGFAIIQEDIKNIESF